MPSKAVGQTFDELLGDLLAEERNVRDSIIQRGAALITGSGALVALSLGISTLTRGTPSLDVGVLPKVLLGVALLFLLSSAVVGLTIATPWTTRTVDLKALPRNPPQTFWTAENVQRAIETYETRVEMALSLRDTNRSRGALLRAGVAIQIAGLSALAVAVGAVLVK